MTVGQLIESLTAKKVCSTHIGKWERHNDTPTTVVNVKVEHIRPEFNNLQEWCEGSNNVYIGRKGVVFINGKRYPPEDSIFANPYKVGKDGTRDEVIQKYKTCILEKIERKEITQDQLDKLRGKKLGCWCKPNTCHGDVLVELIDSNSANYEDYETAADGTPFMEMDIQARMKELARLGYEATGTEAMIDGITGEMITDVFIFQGPTYYQRLRHLVSNKVHARSTGPNESLVRQPTAGRSREGGLKIGFCDDIYLNWLKEMEVYSIPCGKKYLLNHGVSIMRPLQRRA